MDLLELMANLCSKTGLAAPSPTSNKGCLWIHSGTALIEKELATTGDRGLLTILRATAETYWVPRGMVTFFFFSDKCLNVRNMAAQSRATEMNIFPIKYLQDA